MKFSYLFYLILFFLYACKSDSKKIQIWFENNSDRSSVVEVSTYINDSLIDIRKVQQDSISDRVRAFDVKVIGDKFKKTSNLKFVLSGSNDETSCLINIDSMGKNKLVHVNYVERLLKKGYIINSDTLKQDSVVRKEFYCEILK
jgi:hypothetical protein